MSLVHANWHDICLYHPERGAERIGLLDLPEIERRALRNHYTDTKQIADRLLGMKRDLPNDFSPGRTGSFIRLFLRDLVYRFIRLSDRIYYGQNMRKVISILGEPDNITGDSTNQYLWYLTGADNIIIYYFRNNVLENFLATSMKTLQHKGSQEEISGWPL